jgi:3'(2'), 5'-bisphosphate nucleotidase
MQELIDKLSSVCWQAADAIMNYYTQDIPADIKSDGSPLTKADIAAHEIITRALDQLTPKIDIVSEEAIQETDASTLGKQFWLVDPLDGTKEFISKNGEFTINIALIEDNKPILGFVCCPAFETLYVGQVGSGSYKISRDGVRTNLKVSAVDNEGLIVVGSRSHGNKKVMDEFLAEKKVKNFIATGSSLKFCKIAEGDAHYYPRLGRTMEWDTAAGHAVLLAAGGEVNTVNDEPLSYGKPGLDNPHFVASTMLQEYETA